MKITLPHNPTPGEVYFADFSNDPDIDPQEKGEELSLKFSWKGTEDNDDTNYWTVAGTFSWGSKYDDLFVRKSGGVMQAVPPASPTPDFRLLDPSNELGHLINLDEFFDPQIVNGEIVSLFPVYRDNIGAFAIEYNRPVPELEKDLEVRNDAVIGGPVVPYTYLEIKSNPFVEGGEPGAVKEFSYQWVKLPYTDNFDPDFVRSTDTVQKVAITTQGSGYSDGTYPAISHLGTGVGCELTITTKSGDIQSVDVSTEGTGYDIGDILIINDPNRDTDCYVIVTDTIQILNGEEPPSDTDPHWELYGVPIGTDSKKYKIQPDDVDHYIRCNVTCTRGQNSMGAPYTVVSNSNSIGNISNK